jgi:hypothetical protein
MDSRRYRWPVSPAPPFASLKPNLALRQHRLQTPKHNRERFPIILNTRLGLLAPVQAIDERPANSRPVPIQKPLAALLRMSDRSTGLASRGADGDLPDCCLLI